MRSLLSSRLGRALFLSSSALALLDCFIGVGFAQTPVTLPTVHVIASREKLAKREAPGRPTHTRVSPTGETGEAVAARQLAAKAATFDTARSKLYTTLGTTSYKISHETIRAFPQGTNAPVEKVLLQAPGVSQDSAASGLLHVRNDHANVQYRINGVMLPDGVTGFGSVLDTDLIGGIALVTGALPAEFGMRTVGLIDMTTRDDVFNNSGSVSLYGGSFGTLEPSFEYGGTFGGNCGSSPHPGRRPRTVSRASNISSPAAICRPLSESKIRRLHTTPSTISPSRGKASPICRRSSIRPLV